EVEEDDHRAHRLRVLLGARDVGQLPLYVIIKSRTSSAASSHATLIHCFMTASISGRVADHARLGDSSRPHANASGQPPPFLLGQDRVDASQDARDLHILNLTRRERVECE